MQVKHKYWRSKNIPLTVLVQPLGFSNYLSPLQQLFLKESLFVAFSLNRPFPRQIPRESRKRQLK
jgi:hypothetical protein